MKKVLIAFAILSSFIFVSAAIAQGLGMMGGGQDYNYCPYCGQPLGQGGYGMMGPGYGGYGMGPGMMHGYGRGGYGMGPGMMWGGYGRGPGNFQQSEECQKFFDQNAGLRKELNDKRFDYFEAMRNPKTTGESLAKIEKEIRDLQEKIYAKAPQSCWR
jgi:hypothetical protein